MFRPAVRSLLRHSYTRPTTLLRPVTGARTVFTTSSPKRSFKGGLVRWALAGGIVYWYATSNVSADEPKYLEEQPAGPSLEEIDRPRSLLPEKSLKRTLATTSIDEETTSTPIHGETTPATTVGTTGGVEELEEEAGQEGAFNPETGEINWDCPCLGGMAHGPCGEEFKTAFSCFVFSTEDPKGVDCIEKFKGMQSCFQKHPEIYGSELDGDEDEGEDGDQDGDEGEGEGSAASKASSPPAAPKDSSPPSPKPTDEDITPKSQNPPTPNSINKTVAEGSKKEL